MAERLRWAALPSEDVEDAGAGVVGGIREANEVGEGFRLVLLRLPEGGLPLGGVEDREVCQVGEDGLDARGEVGRGAGLVQDEVEGDVGG